MVRGDPLGGGFAGPQRIGEVTVPGRIAVGEASTTRVGELVARQPLSDLVVRNTAIFRDVTNVPPLFGVLSLEPLLVLIEGRGFHYEPIHVDVIVSRPPDGPNTPFLEPSGLM